MLTSSEGPHTHRRPLIDRLTIHGVHYQMEKLMFERCRRDITNFPPFSYIKQSISKCSSVWSFCQRELTPALGR